MVTFSRLQTVRFQHCDPAGIVFYPRYFEMINETVEEWFAIKLAAPFSEIHDSMEAAVPTVATEIKFTAPSRLEDVLEFRLDPVKVGTSSVTLAIAAVCAGEVRLKLITTLVFISKNTGKPRRWPDSIRTRIECEINKQVKNGA